jgi:SAM-dependent methyltransferase
VRLLQECHRLLKTGGRFVGMTPNARGLGHRLFRDHWRDLDPPRHLYVFTPQALRSLIERAGFGAPRLFTIFRDAEWSFLASRSIRRTGHYVWAAREPWAYRVWARGLELGEWALSSVKRDIGEEIAVIAERR